MCGFLYLDMEWQKQEHVHGISKFKVVQMFPAITCTAEGLAQRPGDLPRPLLKGQGPKAPLLGRVGGESGEGRING